ncbi:hypothetical protein Q3G72_007340 [Acer saccharum]|nr:hypothetical protein Q3G72_007340 [Acer saccharum]
MPSSATVRRHCCLRWSKQLLLAVDILVVALVCRSSNLGGAVLDKSLQPHESHIPFILQFMGYLHIQNCGTVLIQFKNDIQWLMLLKLWQVIDGILSGREERLWTPYDNLAKDPVEVIGRLTNFRCLLNRRGVAAAPLLGLGHIAPVEPRSCYSQ